MNRFPRALIATTMVALSTAACGSDSTAPTSASFALHVDSLYEQMESSDISVIAKFTRGFALSDLELPSAYGAHPTAVSVHTASGVERWHGLEFTEPVPNSDGAFHSTLLLYRDANVHTALVVDYEGAEAFATLITNDTLGLIETAGSGSSGETHIDGSCATPPTLQNPVLHVDLSPFCTRAQFSASLSADFTTDVTSDPALSHLEFTATTLEGVHFSGI
jgi:hypothetical protein